MLGVHLLECNFLSDLLVCALILFIKSNITSSYLSSVSHVDWGWAISREYLIYFFMCVLAACVCISLYMCSV